jgi:hypothetical protein
MYSFVIPLARAIAIFFSQDLAISWRRPSEIEPISARTQTAE